MAAMGCNLRLRMISLFLKRNVSLNLSGQSAIGNQYTSGQSERDDDDYGDDKEEKNFEKTSTENDTKQKILNAALNFVPDYGWSQKTLSKGAEMVGFPGVAHGIFPNGGVELAHYFYEKCNGEHVVLLESKAQEKVRTGEFITNAIESRLRMIIPYRNRWPQAMALMSLPQNMGPALGNLTTLVDNIWYYAGDKSTDFNWYTKRGSLAVVYKSTELIFLQDESKDFEQTWQFLRSRILNLESVGKFLHEVRSSNNSLKDLTRGSLFTMRNILGIQDKN